MRDIKFRAWDKVEGKMLELVTASCERKDRWNPLFVSGSGYINGFDHDHYIQMQCTGLKDKNGKEIYEGDILRLNAHQDFFVDFHEGCFVGKSTNKVQRINWLPSALWELVEMEYEVVGNIHENAELLNA